MASAVSVVLGGWPYLSKARPDDSLLNSSVELTLGSFWLSQVSAPDPFVRLASVALLHGFTHQCVFVAPGPS